MEIKLILGIVAIGLVLFFWSYFNDAEKFPLLLYRTPTESGSVCLQMIGKYYGKDLNLDELNILTNRDSSGISIEGITVAAEEKGFNTLAIKVPFENFIEAPLPLIVHARNEFLVVFKMNENKIWVADPKWGEVIYTKKEFCDFWLIPNSNKEGDKLGVAILFEEEI